MELPRQRALEQASIPTLLMCLAQITGDDRWLEEPFLPVRDTQLFGDDTGGLPAEVQETVRAEIAQVLDELRASTRQTSPEPDADRLLRMMNVCVGEDVGAEYVPMFMEEMGVRDRDVAWTDGQAPAAADDFTVLVVGAGIAGIAAAIKLQQLGVDFRIIEKNADLGGTWLENSYPECGVDTPNHFYSYSFATKTDWSRFFSKRDEILDYLRVVAKRHAVADRIEFRTELRAMHWNEADQVWEAEATSPEGNRRLRANVVISAVGQLNRPSAARIDGIDDFPGDSFHSARWNESVNVRGRRVAVVGTGASAIQLLRSVAEDAEQVTVFQRTPAWVRPNPDYHRAVTDEAQWCFENIPYYARWYRFQLFWRFGDALLDGLRRDPEWGDPARSVNRRNDRHREQLTAYLQEELAGRPDLVDKTLPSYPPYAKRILIDNAWFATLRRDNVTLVTDGVDRIEGCHIVTTSGARHEADVLVLATGFDAAHLLEPIAVTGRDGKLLREVWGDDDPRAHLGITVPGFPNFFCLYGPNTNLAHGGSIIFQVECQVRYVMTCLRTMLEADIMALDVLSTVHDDYNRRVDEAHANLVWSHPGVTSWYRNSKERVFSPMPWRLVDYWAMTHDVDLTDFDATEARR